MPAACFMMFSPPLDTLYMLPLLPLMNTDIHAAALMLYATCLRFSYAVAAATLRYALWRDADIVISHQAGGASAMIASDITLRHDSAPRRAMHIHFRRARLRQRAAATLYTDTFVTMPPRRLIAFADVMMFSLSSFHDASALLPLLLPLILRVATLLLPLRFRRCQLSLILRYIARLFRRH